MRATAALGGAYERMQMQRATVLAAASRTPRDHDVGVMPRAPLSTKPHEPLWVFGYGSIVWNVGFEYVSTRTLCARGFRRRFYQGSTDHRGTVEFPGRTVTLEHCDAREVVWGAAYEVAPEHRERVIEYLEVREKQYDARIEMDLFDSADEGAEPVIRNAVTYIATPSEYNLNWLGEADDLAEQIARARGPSGENCEYLYNLAIAMRDIGVEDDHLYNLEAAVRAIRGEE